MVQTQLAFMYCNGRSGIPDSGGTPGQRGALAYVGSRWDIGIAKRYPCVSVRDFLHIPCNVPSSNAEYVWALASTS